MPYYRYKQAVDWFRNQLNMNENFHTFTQSFIPRGAVAFVELGENVGNEMSDKRPVLVVSNDQMNRTSNNVIVAVLTKASNKSVLGVAKILPTQYEMFKKDFPFLSYDSIVLFENIVCVSKKRLDKPIGVVPKTEMDKMSDRIKRTFGLY